MIDKKIIAGKNIYIFESHEMSFAAWGEIKKTLKTDLILLSFDHHTDTHEAFLKHYYEKYNIESSLEYDEDQHNQFVEELLSKIDIDNQTSIYDAAHLLHNDEQIDAAIKKGFVSYAFIITHDSMGTPSLEESKWQDENLSGTNFIRTQIEGEKTPYPKRPYTYAAPATKIFEIDEFEGGQDDETEKEHYDKAIESTYLNSKITVINEMAASIGITTLLETKFILDIDLDYFKTSKSISPDSTEMFYKIVRAAAAITIAKETVFVESVKYPGEEINSESLLNAVIDHIGRALAV